MSRWKRPAWAVAGVGVVASLIFLAAGPRRGTTQPQPRVGARAGALDQEILKRLLARTRESRSDALLVYLDGELVVEWYDEPRGPIELMSATKSVVSLAIGRLIETGKLTSLDQPVHELYPEWKQGRKQLVTIRHLLNHTSGLQNVLDSSVEVLESPDIVKLALAAELSDEPGSRFAYNNKAVNLLAGIVQVASGKRLDDYVRDEILAPMGITEMSWDGDPAGNPGGMSGLDLRAGDLAKLGMMMLDGGVWQGRRIVSEAWVAQSTAAGQALNPKCGLLWRRQLDVRDTVVVDGATLDAWRADGASEDLIARAGALRDVAFADFAAYFRALDAAFGRELPRWYEHVKLRNTSHALDAAPTTGFYAAGYLGQFLVVIPHHRLVAVRQLRAPESEAEQPDPFLEFPDLIRLLVPADGAVMRQP